MDHLEKLKKMRFKKRPNVGKGGGSFGIWTDRVISFLGKVPDAALAAKLGVLQPSVARKRTILRIPAFGNPKGERRGRASKWDPKWTKLLGTMSDSEVSRTVRNSDGYPGKEMVRVKRSFLGIKAYQPNKLKKISKK